MATESYNIKLLLVIYASITVLTVREVGIMSNAVIEESVPRGQLFISHNEDVIKRAVTSSDYVDNEFIDRILNGITQNIAVELSKQRLTYRNMSELTGIDPGCFTRILSGERKLSLRNLIKIAYGLQLSPMDLFPYDLNMRKSSGQRFDDITKDLDIAGKNYCLDMCINYCKEVRRLKESDKK